MIRRLAKSRTARAFSIVARPTFKAKYENFIDGKFVAPINNEVFSPVAYRINMFFKISF